jgi:hypothetical protein
MIGRTHALPQLTHDERSTVRFGTGADLRVRDHGDIAAGGPHGHDARPQGGVESASVPLFAGGWAARCVSVHDFFPATSIQVAMHRSAFSY